MGTDDMGRDVTPTFLHGLWVSLRVGGAAVGFAMVLGIIFGLMAVYTDGGLGALVMRIAEVQLTFPAILMTTLAFGIAKGIPPVAFHDQMAIGGLSLAFGLGAWVQFEGGVRAATLVEKNKKFVAAIRLIGRTHPAVMVRHIVPNVRSSVLVIATISLALATLRFLAIGAPPTQSSLGILIQIGQRYLFSGELWILLFPSLTLLALALSVTQLGDWRCDAPNPRLRRQAGPSPERIFK